MLTPVQETTFIQSCLIPQALHLFESRNQRMEGQTSGTYLASSIQIGPAPSGTLLPAIQLHKSKHIRKLHENQKLCAIFGVIYLSSHASSASKVPKDLPVLKPSWRHTTKASTSSKLSSPHWLSVSCFFLLNSKCFFSLMIYISSFKCCHNFTICHMSVLFFLRCRQTVPHWWSW